MTIFNWLALGASGGGGGFVANFYFDPDAAGGGTGSRAAPFNTTSDLLTAMGSTPSLKIGIKYGAQIRQRLSLTADHTGTIIDAYGDEEDGLPEWRCDDVVPNANFSLASGRTNVYQVTLTVEADADAAEIPGIWENNTRLSFSAVDLSANEGVAGTYWHGSVEGSTSITVYVRPYGSTNPTSDGKVYEAAVRRRGIDTYAASGCTIRNQKGRRNYGSYGSITVGRDGLAQFCEAHEGNSHGIFYRSGAVLEDCLVRNCYGGGVVAGPTSYVGFENTPPAAATCTLTRCRADQTVNPRLPITNITAITQASPGVITAANHGLANGDIVDIASVTGMTQINGTNYRVQNVTTNTFTLQTVNSAGGTPAVNTGGFGAYVSGGTVRLNAYTPEVIGFYSHTSSGTFDGITYEDCETGSVGLSFSAANCDLVTIDGGTITQFTQGFKFACNANVSGLTGVNSPPVVGGTVAVTDASGIQYLIDDIDFDMNSTGTIQQAHTLCNISLTNSRLVGCNQTVRGDVDSQTWVVTGNNFVPNGHAQIYNLGSGGAGATNLNITSDFNAFNGTADGFIIQGNTYATFALYRGATGLDPNSTNTP